MPGEHLLAVVSVLPVTGLKLDYLILTVYPEKVLFKVAVSYSAIVFAPQHDVERAMSDQLVEKWRKYWILSAIGGEIPDWWLSTNFVIAQEHDWLKWTELGFLDKDEWIKHDAIDL